MHHAAQPVATPSKPTNISYCAVRRRGLLGGGNNISALDKELRRLHTGASMTTFLKTELDHLFNGRIIPQNNEFAAIMEVGIVNL
jgi:hypothetical protein